MKMHPRFFDRRHIQTRVSVTAMVLMVTGVLMGGCVTTPQGKVVRNAQAETAFNQYRYLDGHRYYYLGFDSNPDAIVGLAAGYEIDGKSWKPVTQETNSLENMVRRMRNTLPSCRGGRGLSGYSVLDPDEKPIGILYSCFSRFPVWVDADKRVSIAFPEKTEVNSRPRY